MVVAVVPGTLPRFDVPCPTRRVVVGDPLPPVSVAGTGAVRHTVAVVPVAAAPAEV